MHNETSNLNSTLILTENELMDGEESATLNDENTADLSKTPILNQNFENNENLIISESLDNNLLDKIAPITSLDNLQILTTEKLNENLNPSEFSSNSSSYDSDYY